MWVERIIQGFLRNLNWLCQVLLKEERYARLNVGQGELASKLEFVNDVPARVGAVRDDPVLGFLDSPENILANKITALLDREEPKDLADIWGFCCVKKLSLQDAIKNPESKAAGVFPADLGRLLCSATESDWKAIRWINPPSAALFVGQLYESGERLLLAR